MDQQSRPRPKSLPTGVSDFKKLIEGSFAYVDKTHFIKELLDTRDEVAIIPRMRRFGKTLNMSMLRYFFELTDSSNAHLFAGLAISKHPDAMKHQGIYPVISLSFKDIKSSTWTACHGMLVDIIAEECLRHPYLLESPKLEPEERDKIHALRAGKADEGLLTRSLRFLSQCLDKHFGQPPIILIDEYDAPIHGGYSYDYYTEVTSWMRSWFSSGLKDNPHLAFAVITGILRIAKESLFSGLNNDIPYTVLKPNYSTCFGLLEHEVEAWLKIYGHMDKQDVIRRSYDGYTIGNQSGIYNPWSVIECLKSDGVIGNYWAATGATDLIRRLIIKGPVAVKIDLETLLRGETITSTIPEGLVFPTLEQNTNAIWALLLYSGYLTPVRLPPSPKDPCELRIPNEEVRDVFTSIVQEWFNAPPISGQYHEMLTSLVAGDVETFTKRFVGAFAASWSVFDVSPKEPECIYHAFVLGMVVWLQGYLVRSNRESGLGRYDVMLIPKDPSALGVVMEFKVFDALDKMTLEEVATSALTQIEKQRYAEELRSHDVKRILCLGIAFEGKKVHITHRFL